MKVLIEIDTDEIASKMLELGGERAGTRFVWQFVGVMFERYPEMMRDIDTKLTGLTSAVQAVADAGKESARPYFTIDELVDELNNGYRRNK